MGELSAGLRAWIAGRVEEVPGGGRRLRDRSGAVPLAPGEGTEGKDPFRPGDLVELEGALDRSGRFRWWNHRRLCPGRPAPPPGSPNEALWNLPPRLFERRRIAREAVRRFFLDRGFEEVETPCLVPAPGREPHLDPFRTRLEDGAGGVEYYLITSPEYFHKRLLAAGYERIFEITRAFRNGPFERSPLHHFEFVMVEWYRAYASYLEIMADVEALVGRLARNVPGVSGPERFHPPFGRITVEEAFARWAEVDLAPYLSGDPAFAEAEARAGRFGLSPGDGMEARYFKIFLTAVEPNLGREAPVFLVDFPASQAALSKVRSERPEVCERFELYAGGVEVANGFTELNDPEEQRRRFAEEDRVRAARGAPPVPEDPAFLEALDLGIPPSGGVALGFDRLLLVLWGADSLEGVLPWIRG